jgi:hypothetical protein
MLAERVHENGRRLDAMDKVGTRGVVALAAQITDLTADLAGLALQIKEHEKAHREELNTRVSGRRWLVMAVIAVLAVIETPLLYLVTTAH